MIPKTMRINSDEKDALDASTTIIEGGNKIQNFLASNAVTLLRMSSSTDSSVIAQRQAPSDLETNEFEFSQTIVNNLGDAWEEVKDSLGGTGYLEEPWDITVTREGETVTNIEVTAGAKFVFRAKPKAAQ